MEEMVSVDGKTYTIEPHHAKKGLNIFYESNQSVSKYSLLMDDLQFLHPFQQYFSHIRSMEG